MGSLGKALAASWSAVSACADALATGLLVAIASGLERRRSASDAAR